MAAFICVQELPGAQLELRLQGDVPENARWEDPVLALKALRTTGLATLVEVEPIKEATFGANMRAAIVYEFGGKFWVGRGGVEMRCLDGSWRWMERE